jgi:hypothetical protein
MWPELGIALLRQMRPTSYGKRSITLLLLDSLSPLLDRRQHTIPVQLSISLPPWPAAQPAGQFPRSRNVASTRFASATDRPRPSLLRRQCRCRRSARAISAYDNERPGPLPRRPLDPAHLSVEDRQLHHPHLTTAMFDIGALCLSYARACYTFSHPRYLLLRRHRCRA